MIEDYTQLQHRILDLEMVIHKLRKVLEEWDEREEIIKREKSEKSNYNK